jgi:RNA polymerase sigma-70 factor (ECF subfamily)
MAFQLDPDLFAFGEGDGKIEDRKYDDLREKIFPFCLRFLGNREDAEDATSEILVKLWQGAAALKKIENPSGFIYTMIKNHCLDILRKRARRKEKIILMEDGMEDHIAQPGAYFPDQMEVEVYKHLENIILADIKDLSPKQKEVFRLSEEGRSKKDIAKLLGITPTTVYEHWKAAKQQLLKRLRKRGLYLLLPILLCSIYFLKNIMT